MKRRKVARRKELKKRKIIAVTSTLVILLLISVGYGAFQTQIKVNVTGSIKDLKKEIDSKVPMNDLLFWGQADNPENTPTLLKDKSTHANDGILNNFDNTFTSGYNNGELVFDGVDDYVDLEYVNYDFNNTQSYVIYFIPNNLEKQQFIIGNWELSGGGLLIEGGIFKYQCFSESDNQYHIVKYNKVISTGKYYTLVGIYDSKNLKIYINGSIIETSNNITDLKNSNTYISIGSNPPEKSGLASISLKEVMLYDRALTETEVKTITKGFEKKYQKTE